MSKVKTNEDKYDVRRETAVKFLDEWIRTDEFDRATLVDMIGSWRAHRLAMVICVAMTTTKQNHPYRRAALQICEEVSKWGKA